MGDAKWPVCHGQIVQINGKWAYRSGETKLTTLPDDLADELNRLATIDACFAALRTKGAALGDAAIASDAATLIWSPLSPLHHPDELIALHARLKREVGE